MKRWIVLALVLGLFAIMPSSSAHQVSVSDPDDSAGRLDLKSVAFSHGSGKITLDICTYETWQVGVLAAPNNLTVRMKTGATSAEVAVIRAVDGELKGRMTHLEDGEKQGSTPMTVTKTSGPCVRATVDYQGPQASNYSGRSRDRDRRDHTSRRNH